MHLFLSPSLGLGACLGALRLAVEPPVVEVEVDDPLSTDLADGVAIQVVPILVPLQAPQPRVHLSAVAAGEPALAALLVDLGHVQPEEPLRGELPAAYLAVRRSLLLRRTQQSNFPGIIHAFLSLVDYHSFIPAPLSRFFRSLPRWSA